jgi:hypothetical protein
VFRGRVGELAVAELAQHGVIESGIGQLQPEQIFPVDAGADGDCRLPVGEQWTSLVSSAQAWGALARREVRFGRTEPATSSALIF